MLTEEQKQQILNSPNFQNLIKKPIEKEAEQTANLSFAERARIAREKQIPLQKAPTLPPQKKEEGFFDKAKDFGKEVIKGVVKPVVKSFLAPGQAIVSAVTGETPTDLRLPGLGDVTPPQTLREGAGVALQTGLLGVGGGTLAGGGKALAKTAGKEALIGAGFGLGTGLEEGKKGKDLILPTATGATIGALAPVAIKGATKVISKGVGAISKTGKFAREAGKVGSEVIEAGGKIAKEKAPEVAKFAGSQLTGLQPKTISSIIKNPEKFTDEILKNVDSESVGKGVISKIDERVKALSDTGKGYEVIRKSDDFVKIPDDGIKPILNKYNISLDVDGKIVTSPESIPLTTTDKKALQEFVDTFGKETELSANAFLNARTALSNLSAFETGKSNATTIMSKELRKFYDDIGKSQITGLKELDKVYSSEMGILKKVKKDYFNKDGSIKDNAIAKISNLSNKNQVLKRLENIVPDIREQLNILDVVKDIEYASGRAVGTYTRSVIGAGGALTGNVPAMVTYIASSPKVVVPLLRKYGAFAKANKTIIDGIISNLRNGTKLVGQQLKVFKDFLKTSSEKAGQWLKELKDNQAGFAKLPGKSADDSLMQEAKKFKSADEFIESIKEPVLYIGKRNKLNKDKKRIKVNIDTTKLNKIRDYFSGASEVEARKQIRKSENDFIRKYSKGDINVGDGLELFDMLNYPKNVVKEAEKIISKNREIMKEANTPIRTLLLKDVFGNNSDIIKAYPQLKDIKIVADANVSDNFIGGVSDDITDGIRLNINTLNNDKLLKENIRHEAQHLIQKIEDWEGGAIYESSSERQNYINLFGEIQARNELDKIIDFDKIIFKKSDSKEAVRKYWEEAQKTKSQLKDIWEKANKGDVLTH